MTSPKTSCTIPGDCLFKSSIQVQECRMIAISSMTPLTFPTSETKRRPRRPPSSILHTAHKIVTSWPRRIKGESLYGTCLFTFSQRHPRLYSPHVLRCRSPQEPPLSSHVDIHATSVSMNVGCSPLHYDEKVFHA